MKISKKDLTRELPAVSRKNEYQVTWVSYLGGTVVRSVMTNNEIDAARYARERWSANKITKIELMRENIWAA